MPATFACIFLLLLLSMDDYTLWVVAIDNNMYLEGRGRQTERHIEHLFRNVSWIYWYLNLVRGSLLNTRMHAAKTRARLSSFGTHNVMQCTVIHIRTITTNNVLGNLSNDHGI